MGGIILIRLWAFHPTACYGSDRLPIPAGKVSTEGKLQVVDPAQVMPLPPVKRGVHNAPTLFGLGFALHFLCEPVYSCLCCLQLQDILSSCYSS